MEEKDVWKEMNTIKAQDPVLESENKLGFTDQEQRVHDKLMECYQNYLDLPIEHPEERYEFGYAIHLIQGLLAMRIVRRSYPKGWPTYNIRIK